MGTAWMNGADSAALYPQDSDAWLLFPARLIHRWYFRRSKEMRALQSFYQAYLCPKLLVDKQVHAFKEDDMKALRFAPSEEMQAEVRRFENEVAKFDEVAPDGWPLPRDEKRSKNPLSRKMRRLEAGRLADVRSGHCT